MPSNKLSLTAISLYICMAMTACTFTRTTPEPAAARSFQTDAELMARFTDLDTATGRCLINPSKRSSAVSYLLNEDAEELMLVNAANQTAYQEKLDWLNRMAETHSLRDDVSHIVYLLYGRTYVRTTGNEATFSLTPANTAGKRRYAHLDLYNNSEALPSVHIVAPSCVRSQIDIAPTDPWEPYIFELSYRDRTDSTTVSAVICGIGPASQHILSWISHDTASAHPWYFNGKTLSAKDRSCSISIDFTE